LLAGRANGVVLVLRADDLRDPVAHGEHQVEQRRGESDQALDALGAADLLWGRGHAAEA
jgi:hypothetical protein